LVEDLAGAFAGEPVDFAWVVEQVEKDFDGFPAGVDFWVVTAGELALEAFAFVADLAEPLADLLLGPVGVADEVEVTVFLPILRRRSPARRFSPLLVRGGQPAGPDVSQPAPLYLAGRTRSHGSVGDLRWFELPDECLQPQA
jgi:hypothetical protein